LEILVKHYLFYQLVQDSQLVAHSSYLVTNNGLGDNRGTPETNRQVNAIVIKPIPALLRLCQTFMPFFNECPNSHLSGSSRLEYHVRLITAERHGWHIENRDPNDELGPTLVGAAK
jgi:hypothetical protein